MMIHRIVLAAGLVLTALIAGCAHPISVAPSNVGAIKGSSSAKIQKSVGYYISGEDLQREVTTPGGGGDKVSYKPYRDLEPAIYKALNEVFQDVSKLDTAAPKEGVQLVIVPRITTDSSSSSALTWPPTMFTVELFCKVSDKGGNVLTEVKATGTGRAEFSEFKSDFSLAAKRAAQEAMSNLVKALEAAPQLRL